MEEKSNKETVPKTEKVKIKNPQETNQEELETLEELIEKTTPDKEGKSVVNTNIAVLLSFSAVEIIFGFFLNGYSMIADGFHNLVSAVFCSSNKVKFKKAFAILLIPFSAIGIYFSFILMTMNFDYLKYAPNVWTFPIITISFLVKLFFALSALDKIKLQGVKWIKPVSNQTFLCAVTSLASVIGITFSFFSYFFIEASIALAIFSLNIIHSFRIFEQTKRKTLLSIIDEENSRIEKPVEIKDEFAPISVGEILKRSKELGREEPEENKEETAEKAPASSKVQEEKTDILVHEKKKKSKKIFKDDSDIFDDGI